MQTDIGKKNVCVDENSAKKQDREKESESDDNDSICSKISDSILVQTKKIIKTCVEDEDSDSDNRNGSKNSNHELYSSSFQVQAEKFTEKTNHEDENSSNKLDQESENEIDDDSYSENSTTDSVGGIESVFKNYCISKKQKKDWENINENVRNTIIKYFVNEKQIKKLKLENNANKELITTYLIDSFRITTETIKNDIISDKFKDTGTLIKRLSALVNLDKHRQDIFYRNKNHPYNDINDYMLFFQYKKTVQKKEYYPKNKTPLYKRKKILHARYQRNWNSIVNNVIKNLNADLPLRKSLNTLSQKQSQILSSHNDDSELDDSTSEDSENYNLNDKSSTPKSNIEEHLNFDHFVIINDSPTISDQHITDIRSSKKSNIENHLILNKHTSHLKEIWISDEHINDDQSNLIFKCYIINCNKEANDRCIECEGEQKCYCTEHLDHNLHHQETSDISFSQHITSSSSTNRIEKLNNVPSSSTNTNNVNDSMDIFLNIDLQNNDKSNEDDNIINKKTSPVKIFYYLYIIVCANFGICKVGATSLPTYKLPCEFSPESRIHIIKMSLLRRYKTPFGMMKEYISLTTSVFEIEELEKRYTNNHVKDLSNYIWKHFEILFRLVFFKYMFTQSTERSVKKSTMTEVYYILEIGDNLQIGLPKIAEENHLTKMYKKLLGIMAKYPNKMLQVYCTYMFTSKLAAKHKSAELCKKMVTALHKYLKNPDVTCYKIASVFEASIKKRPFVIPFIKPPKLIVDSTINATISEKLQSAQEIKEDDEKNSSDNDSTISDDDEKNQGKNENLNKIRTRSTANNLNKQHVRKRMTCHENDSNSSNSNNDFYIESNNEEPNFNEEEVKENFVQQKKVTRFNPDLDNLLNFDMNAPSVDFKSLMLRSKSRGKRKFNDVQLLRNNSNKVYNKQAESQEDEEDEEDEESQQPKRLHSFKLNASITPQMTKANITPQPKTNNTGKTTKETSSVTHSTPDHSLFLVTNINNQESSPT